MVRNEECEEQKCLIAKVCGSHFELTSWKGGLLQHASERYAFVRRGMLRLVRFVSHCPALPASPAPAMTASEAIVRAERYLRAPPVAKQPPIGPPPKRAPHAPPLPQQQKQQ